MSFFYMYSATGQLDKILIEEFVDINGTGTGKSNKETEEEKKNNAKTRNIQAYTDLNNKYGRGYTILEVKNVVSMVKEAMAKARVRLTPAVKRIQVANVKKTLAENMAKSNKSKYDAEIAKEKESKSKILVSNGRGSTGDEEAKRAALLAEKKQSEEVNIKILLDAKIIYNSLEDDIRDTETLVSDMLVSRASDEVINFYNFCKEAFNPPELTADQIEKQKGKMYQGTDKNIQYIADDTYQYYYYNSKPVIDDVIYVKKNLKTMKEDITEFNKSFDDTLAWIKSVYA